MGAGQTEGADPSLEGGVGAVAARLGLVAGMVVQELGYDEDTDDDLIRAVEKATGTEVVDADADEVVDVVLLWFREDDGDLVDVLVDAIGPLADDGVIWLLTPKRGRARHVDPSEVAEAAPIAGLTLTSQTAVGADWTAARLAARRTRGDKR